MARMKPHSKRGSEDKYKAGGGNYDKEHSAYGDGDHDETVLVVCGHCLRDRHCQGVNTGDVVLYVDCALLANTVQLAGVHHS